MIGFLNTCLWKMNIQIVLIFTIAPVQHKEEFIQQGTFIMYRSFLFIEDFFPDIYHSLLGTMDWMDLEFIL